MNDSKLLDALKETTGLTPPKYTPPPALVQLIHSLAEGVNSGRITSLGAVIVDPRGNVQWPGFGMQTAELFVGAHMMLDDMKAAMRAPKKILAAS